MRRAFHVIGVQGFRPSGRRSLKSGVDALLKPIFHGAAILQNEDNHHRHDDDRETI
jgi:hypothetical protein